VQEEKGFPARQKEEWRSFVFRPPSRRRWGLAGLALSLVWISFGLSAEAPGAGLASPLGVLEGMGALFGSLAELMPEEQITLAGILRLWAGLFVACGFGMMVVGGVLGGGPPGL